MTTTDQTTKTTETGPDGSPREHWTSHHGPDGTTWTRHTWPVADAGPIAEAFIAGRASSPCTIVDADGRAVAQLISDERYDDLQAATLGITEIAARQSGRVTVGCVPSAA